MLEYWASPITPSLHHFIFILCVFVPSWLWLEIDLLRAGKRPEHIAGQSDYCVTLLRRGEPGISAWFVDLRDPLPTVAVPLRPPFEDVPLNLQHVLDETYRRAYYADSLDYTHPVPPPKLKPADEAWVKHLLTAWLNRS